MRKGLGEVTWLKRESRDSHPTLKSLIHYTNYCQLLEKESIHSSILVWKISWTVEPDRLQSMGHRESATTERLTLLELHVTNIDVQVIS